MKAIEIIEHFWAQLQKLLVYARYCIEHDLQTEVCRDFWSWTGYAAAGVGALIALVIAKNVVHSQLQFYRNKRRLELRRVLGEDDAMAHSAAFAEDPVSVNLSQDEIAAMIRNNLKARAEVVPASDAPQHAARPKLSLVRELGEVMKDLTTTLRQAMSTRTIAPAAGAYEAQSDRASEASPVRELTTIMLTDMVGYSGAMEADEQNTYAKLLAHNEIVRAAVRSYRGREIKTIGDAFLVIFRSALDAVDCALAIQRAFTEYNVDKDEADRILLRIGVHLGDILITKDDVFGEGVNIVARIQPLAKPGGICVSDAVYIHVRKKFELKVARVEGADLNLKNIATAPDIYHISMT